MNDYIYLVVRKSLRNHFLNESERRILAEWDATARPTAQIFEDTRKKGLSKKEYSELVYATENVRQLRILFQKLFSENANENGNTRRKLPIALEPDDDSADIETASGIRKAHFEIWELDDIIPSHDPLSQFAKRDDYPSIAQERPYHSDTGEQEKVRRNASKLNPRYLINTNPDAMSGPPIVTSKGIVLGGNSRTMSMQLAYASYPAKAKAYKEELIAKANAFGFTKAQVKAMEKPTLVRVLNASIKDDDMAEASRRFNQSTTQALQTDAEGVSKSRLISRDTLATFRDGMQEFDTLREFLGSIKSREFIDALVNDGVIETTQISRITDIEGLLNSEGKALAESVLRGLIVQDYDVIRKAPSSVLTKIDRAVPSLSQLKSSGGLWDISKYVTAALQQIITMVATGNKLSDADAYFGQTKIEPEPVFDNKAVQALALMFANSTSKEISARLAVFAHDSKRTAANGGNSLVAELAPPSPRKAFANAFLKPIATIDGGKPVEDFAPTKNEVHAAIQWAFDNTKHPHNAESAVTVLSEKLGNAKISSEEKKQLMSYLRALARHSGPIAVFYPNLGKFYRFSPKRGDTFLGDLPDG